jgi:WD40 repeat protein
VDNLSLAFGPEGKILASIGSNGLLRIEEVAATGVEVAQRQFPRDFGTLALSPDGSTLAISTGPNSHKLYFWKWAANEEPREVKVPWYAVRRMSFSPDGTLLAALPDDGGALRVWEVATGKLLHQLDPPRAERHSFGFGVAFSPDGKTLAATGHRNDAPGVIHLWDVPSGQYREELPGAGGWLAFSPDSKLLAATGAGDVRVWDLATHKEVAANDAAHRQPMGHVVVTADGLIVTASEDYTVRTWDLKTGRQKFKLVHDGWVRAIAVSPDGSRLASSAFDDTVRLWDLKTGREIYQLPGHGQLGGQRALAFTADGKRFVSWGDDWFLRGWDVATGKAFLDERLKLIDGTAPVDGDAGGDREGGAVDASAFSPNGTAMVLRCGSKMHSFDATSGRPIRFFETGYESGYHVAVSPNGKQVLVSEWSQPIEMPLPGGGVRRIPAKNHPVGLWDLAEGKLIRETTVPGSAAGAVTFSADGKMCAAAAGDPEPLIQLWDAASGEELQTISHFRQRVTALAFSPDGRYLVGALNDTTALVWDLKAERSK